MGGRKVNGRKIGSEKGTDGVGITLPTGINVTNKPLKSDAGNRLGNSSRDTTGKQKGLRKK